MALILQEHVSLKEFSTFLMGGRARYFAELKESSDMAEISVLAKQNGLELFLLGKGSNCIFSDLPIDKVIGLVAIQGLQILEEEDEYVTVKIGAGEVWDDVVEWSVKNSWSGIEALSAIPGTAGATPVQNVGAYGQEIKDVFVELSAYDRKNKIFVILKSDDCGFGYRSSIFNTTEKGRYLIASITLRLSKKAPTIPKYPGVQEYFKAAETPFRPQEHSLLREIREVITAIRASKLPDPLNVASVGSFFKNSVVEKSAALALKEKFPDMPLFEQPDGRIKMPSGWLIEQSGLKGRSFGHISIYEKNALVLINDGDATFNELMETKEYIIQKVREKFGVELVQEPIVVE
jgi:UDP-N-acetylmuramate dehydrogenase